MVYHILYINGINSKKAYFDIKASLEELPDEQLRDITALFHL